MEKSKTLRKFQFWKKSKKVQYSSVIVIFIILYPLTPAPPIAASLILTVNNIQRKPRETSNLGENPPKYTTAYIVQQSNCRWHCEPTSYVGLLTQKSLFIPSLFNLSICIPPSRNPPFRLLGQFDYLNIKNSSAFRNCDRNTTGIWQDDRQDDRQRTLDKYMIDGYRKQRGNVCTLAAISSSHAPLVHDEHWADRNNCPGMDELPTRNSDGLHRSSQLRRNLTLALPAPGGHITGTPLQNEAGQDQAKSCSDARVS
jgi:hypothetical protein